MRSEITRAKWPTIPGSQLGGEKLHLFSFCLSYSYGLVEELSCAVEITGHKLGAIVPAL